MPSLRLLLLLLIAPAALAGQNVAEVQVTPDAVSLKPGAKQALFAAAFDAKGNLIPTARFTYSSSDTVVARADPDGAVVGLAAGRAIVRVRAGQKSFNVAVVVVAPDGSEPVALADSATGAPPSAADSGAAPTLLTINPATIYLLPSESRALEVRAFRPDGSPAPLRHVVWKSLSPEVAAVDVGGVVVGLKAGQATLQVSAGALSATAPVEVRAAEFTARPSRIALAPLALDTVSLVVPEQDNRELHAGISWQVADTAIARVGPTGVVQGLAPGHTELLVSGYFQQRQIPVAVHRPIARVVVTPAPGSGPIRLPLRGTSQVAVRALAADSSAIPEVDFDWELGDTTVAGFDPATRTLTARATGTTSLTLRAPGFAPLVWVVEVVPGGIAFDRPLLTLAPGSRDSLGVHFVNRDGAPAGSATGLLWITTDSNVVALAGNGRIVAHRPGRVTLMTETRWGAADSATVFVIAPLLVASNRTGRFALYQVTEDSTLLRLAGDTADMVQPALSPDRSWLAYSSNRSGDFDLYLARPDGSGATALSPAVGLDGEPAWMPDGKSLVFASSRTGSPQIFRINADGTGLRQLTFTGGGNRSPAVSPDGESIAFLSGRDGNTEVYRMRADGTAQANVTGTPQREAAVRYLPDGALVFATEVRRGPRPYRLLRVPLDGTPAEPLFTSDDPITDFAVARDGRQLAVVTGHSRGIRVEYALHLVPVGGAGAPVQVPLRPGEQIVSPNY